MKGYLIKSVMVWTPEGFRKLDVAVMDGVVTGMAESVSPEVLGNESGIKVIEGEGKHLLPGLCDLHVHFREPGYSYKETISAGSKAAAHGGFTLVCPMPNLNPAPDSVETLAEEQSIIGRDAVIKVLPYATITRERMGELPVDYAAMAGSVAGFSDDGTGVQSAEVMERCMEGIASTGALLAAHCEVDSLLNGGYIHDGKYAREHGHRGICSESEWREVERDMELAEKTGCRLHICHVSTAESVELVRQGKKRGVKVTCETAPHYLILSEDDLQEHGRFKMNPPLRANSDREALVEGLRDGTVDAIATDHAPHADSEKEKGLEKSAMGVTGIECSLPAIYTHLVLPGVISMERMVEAMAVTPRRLLGLTTEIKVGEKADFTLVDFNDDVTVNREFFLSKGKYSPFGGMTMKGRVLLTVADGKEAYSDL